MAYHDRHTLLKKTLDSYKLFYSDVLDDIEIVLINDTPSLPNGDPAIGILETSGIPYQYHVYNRSIDKWRNPGPVYNRAAEKAKYDFFHLTNPENLHLGPVLKHCQDYMTEDNYIVYGCRSLKVEPLSIEQVLENPDSLTDWQDANGWYQHTKIDNRLLHFGSIISKQLYNEIGGFDNQFAEGVAFEDNDFIQTIISNGTNVLAFDDPCVAHQRHDRSHIGERYAGFEVNKQKYLTKWKAEPPVHREGW